MRVSAWGTSVSRRSTLRIGVLFSVTGPYRTIGAAMRNGALLAVAQINADDRFPFRLEVVEHDPGGQLRRHPGPGPVPGLFELATLVHGNQTVVPGKVKLLAIGVVEVIS